MQRKTFNEVLATVTAQLMLWVPPALLLLNIHSTNVDISTIVGYVAPPIAGVLWFVWQIRQASRQADEKGVLWKPEWFWTLWTGKISSRLVDMRSNRELFIIGRAAVVEEANVLFPSTALNSPDSPVTFFTITEEVSPDTPDRQIELADLHEKLSTSNPVAVVVIDDGGWGKLRDYEATIRSWGASHSELPIFSVKLYGVGEPGGPNPSINFSAVELRRIQKSPVLGLANRLLQQTALRGELWKKTASQLRWIALASSLLALLFGGLFVGVVAFARHLQSKVDTNARSIEQYQHALTFPASIHAAILQNAGHYRAYPKKYAQDFLNLVANSLHESLITAHGSQWEDFNVVMLGVVPHDSVAFVDGDSTIIVEVSRIPSDTVPREPFGYRAQETVIHGIAACAVVTGAAVYWKGTSSTSSYATDSIVAWDARDSVVGAYVRGDTALSISQKTCKYKKLPPTVPDNDRHELLCVPVGMLSNVQLPPVGAICVSSNNPKLWLSVPWVRSAMLTTSLWAASIDWQQASTERFLQARPPNPPRISP